MSPERIRIGLIGGGNFARKAHIPSLQALADRFQVVAVCTRRRESAEAVAEMFSEPISIYDQIPALLAQEDLDAVDVILPIPQMAEAIAQVLESDKHLISEKPIAAHSEEARQLIETYRRSSGRVWMVAENWRYEQAVDRAQEAIADGYIGRPLIADWSLQLPVPVGHPYHETTWRRSNLFQGGFLLDGGVHHVAGLRALLGEVESVNAIVSGAREDLPPADTLVATLRFENGTLATYAVTYAVEGPLSDNGLHIVGSEGSLRLAGGSLTLRRGDEEKQESFGRPFSVERELAAFSDAILKKEEHRNSPEAALTDLLVVEAMLRSASSGCAENPQSATER